jgi:hypothetical protein
MVGERLQMDSAISLIDRAASPLNTGFAPCQWAIYGRSAETAARAHREYGDFTARAVIYGRGAGLH